MRATAQDSKKNRGRKLARPAVVLAVFLASPGFVFPLDYLDALAIEETGSPEAAVEAYRAVLATEGEDHCLAVLRIYRLLDDIPQKRTVLENALGKCSVATQRHAVLKALAELEEITGNLAVAQTLYLQASFTIPNEKDFESLLSSALLLFELGEYRGAEAQATAIVETTQDAIVRGAAQILLSRIYFATEREQKSLEIAASLMNADAALSPSGLLWVVEISRLLGDEDLAQRASRILEREYPRSPELGLLRRELDYLPSPAVFLGLPLDAVGDTDSDTEELVVERPRISSVQTGSYGVRENAEYALSDLKEAGFSGAIREVTVGETLYYRVVLVGVPEDDVDAVILSLREKGFEGFRIAE